MNEDELSEMIIGESAAIGEVRRQILRVAPADVTVFLQGPTGSGKELVARALHQASERVGKYVEFNTCAIAETMFEATLFGHVKGAFTGADANNPGLLAEADGGTIFFDEIGELSLGLQPKLLRAVESKSYRSVGATRDRRSDFRLVSATNRRLRTLVDHGQFRPDLAERLSTFIIAVPPLGARLEDVPAIAQHFVDVALRESGRELSLSKSAIRSLQQYDWPRNVRELHNVVKRLVLMVDGSVASSADVARAITMGMSESLPIDQRTVAERRELVETLEGAEWNAEKAAETMKVSRATIYRRMGRLGVRRRGR
jgi:two-component system nitrogen regulation response regulator NtrX